MKKQWFAAVLTALILSISAHSASAGEIGVSVEFSDKEISAIRAYYRDHSDGGSKNSNGKKGNGKNKGHKSLPPGIAMNLQRGKALPPGIAKQALPMGLIELLPAPPRGFERVEIDGRVLLVEVAHRCLLTPQRHDLVT